MCAAKPFLPVLSLHQFLGCYKLSHFLSSLTTIALLLLVCIVLQVVVLLSFLEDFLTLSGFLSSTRSRFIICGDINVHLDVECCDRSRFSNILQCCGLVQSVNGPTHLLGHTLDVLISTCDSDIVHNVCVGDFNSDHAAIRCQLDFSHPSTSIDKWIPYHQYHRINIDQFRNDLNNIPFVRYPEGTAAELYDQYITGVTQVLGKYALLISRKEKQQSDEWLPDSYHMARSLRWQFEEGGENISQT